MLVIVADFCNCWLCQLDCALFIHLRDAYGGRELPFLSSRFFLFQQFSIFPVITFM